MQEIGPLKILRLRGTPAEMGREYGELMKSQLGPLVRAYLRKSQETFEVPYDFLMRMAEHCRRFVPEEYLEEIEALSAAADVGELELLALNCLSDIDGCYTQQVLQCCNFVLSAPATADDLFLHGRNLDFPPGGDIAASASVMIVRTPSAANTFPTLSIGFYGHVGMYTGYSGARLSCGEVSVPAKDTSLNGVPLSLLMRRGLERAESCREFVGIMREAPRTCGYNLAVSDGKAKRAYGVEMTHKRCEARRARDGVLVVDDVCFCKATARDRLTYPAGAFRHARAMQLIAGSRGRITVERALEFLQDTYDVAWANPNGTGYNCLLNHHTLHSVLFLPAEDRLFVAFRKPDGAFGEYTEIGGAQLWEGPAEEKDAEPPAAGAAPARAVAT